METSSPWAKINVLIYFTSIWSKLELVDVAMTSFEGGCLVVVHAVLSVDVWELVMVE